MKIFIPELVVPADSLAYSPDQELHDRIARHCGIKASDVISYQLEKRSLDARKKPHVKILYRLTAELKDSARPDRRIAGNPLPEPVELWHPPEFPDGKQPMINPVIVGAGPAGLFAALTLALAGCKPIILERGFDVDRRKEHIDHFFQTRQLNVNSNLLFGEGGAGTWSDGKLFTRIRDPRMNFVMRSFVNGGANPNILYYSHPHIGSDKLPSVIASLRQQIIDLGGSFQWGSCVEKVLIRDQKCCGVILDDHTVIEAPAVLIACGHSARPLILNLLEQHVAHQMKGFQIGCRMEHPQEFINLMQFGVHKTQPALGAAEYSLMQKAVPEKGLKGAVSFCMCPGGEILPATCDVNGLCTNGMSNAARDGRFANAALVASIDAGEFSTAQEAFAFLYRLEQKAFQAGGSDYTVPAQSASAFVKGEGKLRDHGGSYRLGMNPCRLDCLLPDSIRSALANALQRFDRMMPGFMQQGNLVGLETRVSSPVRFLRDPETLSSSVVGLYLAGEGAGMAGGITSAAVDGIKIAEAMTRVQA